MTRLTAITFLAFSSILCAVGVLIFNVDWLIVPQFLFLGAQLALVFDVLSGSS